MFHIRKPSDKFIGWTDFCLKKEGNIIGNYKQELINIVPSDDGVYKTTFTIENKIINGEKYTIQLNITDSYGVKSPDAFLNFNGDNQIFASFYLGKIKINLSNYTSNQQITVSNSNNILYSGTPNCDNNTIILPWILLYKDTCNIINISNIGQLFLHIEGYTTPPSTYIGFNYNTEIAVQLIKFKITEIQSDRIYFAFLNFRGGYQGLQCTPDMRINKCKNILISSQWHNNLGNSEIVCSNESNLVEDFGGEGTGVKFMMDYNWIKNQTYGLVTHAHIENSFIYITRYVIDYQTNKYTYIGTTKTPTQNNELLGKNVTSFLEAWTNEAIQTGEFYQKAFIYGGWAMDNTYKWMIPYKIDTAATGSILDPNDDLFEVGYDAQEKAYYYSHGYNKNTNQIAMPQKYDSVKNKWIRSYDLNTNNIKNPTSSDYLFYNDSIQIKSVIVDNILTVRISTEIPYFKISILDFISQKKYSFLHPNEITIEPTSSYEVSIYDIYGTITKKTVRETEIIKLVKLDAITDISANFSVSNIYIKWNGSLSSIHNNYRIKLFCDNKIIFDTQYTIKSNKHVLQFIQRDQTSLNTMNNKYIYVNDWPSIQKIQQDVINKKYKISISSLNSMGVSTKEYITNVL